MDSPASLPTGDSAYAIGVEFRCDHELIGIENKVWVYGSPAQNSANGMILQRGVTENRRQYTFYHFWYGMDISWTIEMTSEQAADDTVCDGNWHHVGATWASQYRRSIWFDHAEVEYDYPTGGTHADTNDNFCLGGENNAGRLYQVFNGDIRNFEVFKNGTFVW